jgi:hypothetical protein
LRAVAALSFPLGNGGAFPSTPPRKLSFPVKDASRSSQMEHEKRKGEQKVAQTWRSFSIKQENPKSTLILEQKQHEEYRFMYNRGGFSPAYGERNRF